MGNYLELPAAGSRTPQTKSDLVPSFAVLEVISTASSNNAQGSATVHPDLGVEVQMPTNIVFDPHNMDQFGTAKWVVIQGREEIALLNPKYKMVEQEKECLLLNFLVFSLGGESNMRRFFEPGILTSQHLLAMVGNNSALYRFLQSQKPIYQKWKKYVSSSWCDIRGNPRENAKLLRQISCWLLDHGQPNEGTPEELMARYCALRLNAVDPSVQIRAWVKANNLPHNGTPESIARVFCRAHLLHSLDASGGSGAIKRGSVDVFALALEECCHLLEEKLRADPGLRAHVEGMHACVELTKDAGETKVEDILSLVRSLGLVTKGTLSQMWSKMRLFLYMHTSRAFLIKVLTLTGMEAGINIQTEPKRKLFRMVSEIFTGGRIRGELYRYYVEGTNGLQKTVMDLWEKQGDDKSRVTQLDKVGQYEALMNAVFTSKDLAAARDIKWHCFVPASAPMQHVQYLDALLEYGGLAVLQDSSADPGEVDLMVKHSGVLSKSKLIGVLRTQLLENKREYLRGWFHDRAITCSGKGDDECLRLYSQFALCLYFQNRCGPSSSVGMNMSRKDRAICAEISQNVTREVGNGLRSGRSKSLLYENGKSTVVVGVDNEGRAAFIPAPGTGSLHRGSGVESAKLSAQLRDLPLLGALNIFTMCPPAGEDLKRLLYLVQLLDLGARLTTDKSGELDVAGLQRDVLGALALRLDGETVAVTSILSGRESFHTNAAPKNPSLMILLKMLSQSNERRLRFVRDLEVRNQTQPANKFPFYCGDAPKLLKYLSSLDSRITARDVDSLRDQYIRVLSVHLTSKDMVSILRRRGVPVTRDCHNKSFLELYRMYELAAERAGVK